MATNNKNENSKTETNKENENSKTETNKILDPKTLAFIMFHNKHNPNSGKKELLIKKFTEGFWDETNKPTDKGFNKTDEGKKFVIKMQEIYKIFNKYHSDHCVWMQYSTLIKYGYKKPNLFKKGYMGHAHCRVCNIKNNGSEDFLIELDGVEWIIPEGYLHYLENHGIEPSKEFQEFINSLDLTKLTTVRELTEFEEQLVIQLNFQNIIKGMDKLVYSA